MADPKIVNGKIKYLLKTFDGSYVSGEMFEDEARVFLSGAKKSSEVPGYELSKDNYLFETKEVELTLGRKSKKETNDEA